MTLAIASGGTYPDRMGWRVAQAYEDDRRAERGAGPFLRRYAWWRIAGLVLTVAIGAFLLAPERHLACKEAWLSERSPDGAWTLTVCRRPMLFAMPGGSSDAPGWIVLRDAEGAIRGVVHLGMMQMLSETGSAGGTVWTPGDVTLSRLATLPLDAASGPATRWLGDRLWRVRALLGLVPSDEISSQ